jgi:hypothetical protein
MEYTDEWRRRHAERLQTSLERAHARCIIAADLFARRFLPMLLAMQRHGKGLRAMATEMNLHGYLSRYGGPWTDQTVRQMLKRRQTVITTEVFDQPRRFIGWNRAAK